MVAIMHLVGLRLWFVRPLRDPEVLKQRQDAIEFFCNPQYLTAVTSLVDCLKNVVNLPVRLQCIVSKVYRPRNWVLVSENSCQNEHIPRLS